VTVDLIEFPDVELLVADHLRDMLGATVLTRLPAAPGTRPTEFLLVERTGGPRATIVSDRPQVTIEAWATSKPDAHDLIQQARTRLHGLRGTHSTGSTIYRTDEAAGPAWLPDPESDTARYTFTATLHVRGSVLTGS